MNVRVLVYSGFKNTKCNLALLSYENTKHYELIQIICVEEVGNMDYGMVALREYSSAH